MKRQSNQTSVYAANTFQPIKSEVVIVWGLPLAFCLHLLDEIFMNRGFVSGVQGHIWPSYDVLRFGLVNAAFFILFSLSSYLYSIRPDKWLVLPLFWLWERTWNGLWHVLWVFIWKEYSPGLVTSLLFGWGLIWLLRRESSAGRLDLRKAIFTGATGLVFELLFISSLFILRRI